MVSGGQDSLALLDILCESAGRAGGPAAVRALHINHHLRGNESDYDEALVVRACGERGVGLTVAHRPVAKTGGNVQERAREARRRAALDAAADHGCDRIALGHTADDQAETLLYRLGRYGGLAALRGMTACDPPWVRPLLECRRAETEAYCAAQGIEFARDRGNAYPGYARTPIREQVLPAWEAALPGAVEAAARAAEVAAELERFADDVLQAAWPAVTAGQAAGGGQTLDVRALLDLDPAVRRLLLHRWLEGAARPAASRASVLALESLLQLPGSAERNLGGGWRGVKEYGVVSLEAGRRPAQAAPAPDPVRLCVPGRAEWGGVVVEAAPADRFMAPDIALEAFVDARCLAGEVEVRGPRPGDRVRPLGAPGTRKLQDVFVDLRVPAARRPAVPLVVCDGRVTWVCGLLVSEEGRIAGDTTGIVRLTVEAAQDRRPDLPSPAKQLPDATGTSIGDGQP
jgi:tRNA(Ile)-lysidine synthase